MSKTIIDFDTDAWLSDHELRMCEPQDRGVLIDIMCLAKKGQPEGHVTTGKGAAISDSHIARFLHMDQSVFCECKSRLLASNRICIAEHTGAIYVPRMVRDAAIREASTDGGRKGGNPQLTRIGDEPDAKPKASKPITVAYFWNKLPCHLQTPDMRDAVAEWIEYRQRTRLVLTTAAVAREVRTLSPLTAPQAVEWITCAIDKQWRGFYPPPQRAQEQRRSDDKSKEYRSAIHVPVIRS